MKLKFSDTAIELDSPKSVINVRTTLRILNLLGEIHILGTTFIEEDNNRRLPRTSLKKYLPNYFIKFLVQANLYIQINKDIVGNRRGGTLIK